MSNYHTPAPHYVGRTVEVFESAGAFYFSERRHHETTIVDASDPTQGGLTFQAADGMSYRWEDERVSWQFVD